MKATLRIIAIVLIAAVGIAAAWWHWFTRPTNSTGRIRVSGNIETTETQVSFRIGGRVEKRFVDEGEAIAADAPVAELDSSDLRCNVELRKAELGAAQAALAALEAGSRPQEKEAARAALEKARHALADLLAGSRPQEIESANAAVIAAEAEKSRLEADFGRAEALYARNAISTEQFDAVRALHDVAVQKYRQAVEQWKLVVEGPRKEQIEQARQALQQAQAQYDLVLEGPRREDIDQGKARVEQARAALKLAETQLGYAKIVSPLTGVVLSKNIEPGEFVAPGTPVVTVGDIENVWLRAYIEAADQGPVVYNRTAWVTVDSLPGKRFKGRVSFVAEEAEFTPKTVQTQKERVKLVYRIKIDIKNPDWELKPGMPADAEIELSAAD